MFKNPLIKTYPKLHSLLTTAVRGQRGSMGFQVGATGLLPLLDTVHHLQENRERPNVQCTVSEVMLLYLNLT